MTNITRRGLFAAAVFAVAGTIAGCTTTGTKTGATSQPNAPTTTASSGAGWNARTATITLGSGSTAVDLWLDLRCPHCKDFDEVQRTALAHWATGSSTRLVLHPMTFLDRASEGTRYSTRAATVLIAAANQNRDAVLPILSALFDAQPGPGPGLDDGELIDLATQHGVNPLRALELRRYDDVLERRTTAAFTGTNPITGTPTLRYGGVTVPAEDYDRDLQPLLTTNWRSEHSPAGH